MSLSQRLRRGEPLVHVMQHLEARVIAVGQLREEIERRLHVGIWIVIRPGEGIVRERCLELLASVEAELHTQIAVSLFEIAIDLSAERLEIIGDSMGVGGNRGACPASQQLIEGHVGKLSLDVP